MGSAYLSEILTCEGDFLTDINFKINEIVQQNNSLKKDIRSIIDEENINFKPFIKENSHLKTRAQALIQNMTVVQQHIVNEIKPELSSCSIELRTLSRSLQEVNISLCLLNQMIELHSLIKSANTKMHNKEFYECAKLITNVQQLIKDGASDLKQLEMFKTLSNEVVISYELLLHQISDLWSLYVTIDENEKNDTKEITFSVDINSAPELSEILKAVECLKCDLIEKKFINMYLTYIINEIVMHKLVISAKVDEKAVLILEISKVGEKPHYTEVFNNLKVAVEFLKYYLNVNVNVQDGTTFLHKIGTDVGNELAKRLIKNCLSETIPTSSEDLEMYNNVVKCTEEFEVSLKECGFLPEKSTCLIDYAKNINVLFANKFCQSYLEKARVLMKKDLHNVTTAQDIIISNINILPKTHQNILKSKLNIQNDNGFIFPKCQISKAAEEVTDLVKDMISEIVKSEELCAVRLFYTVRNIFEMYSAVVPVHHKKFLDTLPHQVALFHNNCMYFTYFLINLTCEYYKKIPTVLNDEYDIFLEEAVSLRTLAVDKLEEHVTSQKNQLVYILRDSGIFKYNILEAYAPGIRIKVQVKYHLSYTDKVRLATLNEEPKLNPDSEKSVRQCIRQLQILQSVWKDVLPSKVYNRAIGFLLDSIIEELISLIIAVEDIPSQTASDLASMFSIIVNRAPALFPESKEIFRHAKNWQKLNEFIGVLKGSLRDIDDRWSDGMGPLANEFTAEQIKHLIRALFQNSDRRSTLLHRIK